MRDERPEGSTTCRHGDISTLGHLRLRAAQLKQQGLTYRDIAETLGTTAIRARDLCKQYERLTAHEPRQSYLLELSSRAIMALLTGSAAERYAPDADMDERLALLVEIACLYDRNELLKEQFVGQRTCSEIEAWLLTKGRSFRCASTARPVADRKAISEQPAFHPSPSLTGLSGKDANSTTRSTARAAMGKPAQADTRRASRRMERSARRQPKELAPATR